MTTEAEESPRLESGLVGQPDYGGYDFNIYLHGAHGVNDFKGEEQNGEVINDAQYERTAKVEELYNVKISYKEFFSVDNSDFACGDKPSMTTGDISTADNASTY